MAGLKNYLKEKPRGPRFQDEEAISSLSQVSNLADAAELTCQEIKTLNKNKHSSAFVTPAPVDD
jgi:hypothetical protein